MDYSGWSSRWDYPTEPALAAIAEKRRAAMRPRSVLEGKRIVRLVNPGATRDSVSLRSRLDVRLDVIDCLLHRGDLLGFLVGDLALELFFQRHHKLDGVQRVRAQVFHERSVVGDFVFLYAKLFDDDFFDALFDAAHLYSLRPRGIFDEIV